jgi:LMBR1 domain-containing protein 1
MTAFWYIIYIVVLVFITILMPYAIFLYETDEEDSMCKRLLSALFYTIGALVISLLILFISWIFFRYVDLTYTEVTLTVNQTNDSSKTKTSEQTIEQ